jgi:hypothetical protein
MDMTLPPRDAASDNAVAVVLDDRRAEHGAAMGA